MICVPSGFFVPAAGGGGDGEALTKSFLSTVYINSSQTTYTVNGYALGEPHADRHIVLAVVGRTVLSGRALVSATIGGVSCTLDSVRVSGQDYVAVVRAHVPSGTTGQIVLTFTADFVRIGIFGYRIQKAGLVLEDAQSASTMTTAEVSLEVSTGSAIIGAVAVRWVEANQAPVLTGITEDGLIYQNNACMQGASAVADSTGIREISATSTSTVTNVALAVASYS